MAFSACIFVQGTYDNLTEDVINKFKFWWIHFYSFCGLQ